MERLGIENYKKKFPNLRFPEFKVEWSLVLLEDVAVRGSGHTPNKQYPEYYNGDIKWVSLADSKKLDNGYIDSTEISISNEGVKNSSAVLHPKGSVLLSRDAGVGKSAVMKTDMAVSQHFIVWQTKREKLSNWFLYYMLQILKPELERIAIGSTIKTIGLPYFKKLQITIPSFSEQQKIASFLLAIDEKIQQLTRKKELLEKYKKGVMQQLFSGKLRFKVENGKAYPKWEEKKFRDLGEFRGGGTPNTKNEKYWRGSIPWISSSDLNENNIHRINVSRHITEEAIIESATKLIPKGSIILISRVGVGKLAVNNVSLCTSQDFTNFIPKNCDPFFIAYLLIARKEILKNLSQGTSIKGFTTEDLKAQIIPVPLLEEQQKIAKNLSAIDSKIEIVNSQITQTQTFKKGLLQQMFV